MSLEYASDHLTAAVRSLATSEDQLVERVQAAWDEHVQMVWMKPCLTRELLREFRAFGRECPGTTERRFRQDPPSAIDVVRGDLKQHVSVVCGRRSDLGELPCSRLDVAFHLVRARKPEAAHLPPWREP